MKTHISGISLMILGLQTQLFAMETTEPFHAQTPTPSSSTTEHVDASTMSDVEYEGFILDLSSIGEHIKTLTIPHNFTIKTNYQLNKIYHLCNNLVGLNFNGCPCFGHIQKKVFTRRYPSTTSASSAKQGSKDNSMRFISQETLIAPPCLDDISWLYKLKSLDISSTNATAFDLEWIISKHPGLESLKANNCYTLQHLGIVKFLENLQTLELNNTALSDHALEQILRNCTHLTHLSCVGCKNITASSAPYIRTRAFEFLDLTGTSLEYLSYRSTK